MPVKKTVKKPVGDVVVKNEQSLEIITNEVSPVVKDAQDVKIENAKDMERATFMLSRLNQMNDKVVEEREKVTVPLNQALKAERGRWKPIETILGGAIDHVRGVMGAYQTRMVNEQREEEARIAARVGEGKGKLKVETAIRQMDEVEKPAERVETNAGVVKFRTDKVLKIVDETLIPHEYYDLNEKRVLDALKEDKDVPGTVIEEIQVPINHR